MKLFTKPRPFYPHQLRPGDQIATHTVGGDLVRSETAYVDADLGGQVRWSVVHATFDVTIDRTECTRILHTLGEHDVRNSRVLICRETIEIDPWTYLKPPEGQE